MNITEVIDHVRTKRHEILTAELAGLLHVINRLDERFKTRSDPKSTYNIHRVVAPAPKHAFGPDRDAWLSKWTGDARDVAEKMWRFAHELSGALTSSQEARLRTIRVPILDEDWTLGEIVSLRHRMFLNRQGQIDPRVATVLGRPIRSLDIFQESHTAASVLKGMKDSAQPPVKTVPADYPSTVFGDQTSLNWSEAKDFEDILDLALTFDDNRREFIVTWEQMTRFTYADDRVPYNDISNWAYSKTVAAFFKSAVARLWVEGCWPADTTTLRWTLVAIGYPGLEFLGEALRITDVLARRAWMEDKLDSFRRLVEDEVPLANEVYRDENGAIFLAAEIEGVPLDLLVRTILEPALDSTDDLQPSVRCDYAASRHGLFPIWRAIKEIIKQRQPIPAERFRKWWSGAKERVICPVCKLRPMAREGEAEERSLCQICFERRSKLRQSEKWIMGEKETVWIDEVADVNGICALLVGRLDLRGWLENDVDRNYFRVLLKNPDFMRVQSAWDTTRAFWEEMGRSVLDDDKQCPRLSFHVRNGHGLRRTYVYETSFLGAELAAVWTGERFRTASNLDYFRKQAGLEPGTNLVALLQGKRLLMRLPQGYEKEDAGNYQEREKVGVVVTVDSVQEEARLYRPVITILAEPRHFLAIVPAAHALAVCNVIRGKYREAFGKVRSMLPLSVGIVFFDRRTPIYAVMQAGQKLLRLPELEASVTAAQWDPDPCDQDSYYARVRLATGGQDSAAALKDLQGGNSFLRAISLFDYLHLETTGQRYRLAYDPNDGRRLDPAVSDRAFSFERYDRLERLWKLLAKGLTTAQINALFSGIEQKREEWALSYPARDAVLQRLTRALIDAADWKLAVNESDRTMLLESAADGLFRDAVELHMKILKEGGREES
jgi:hypothetical protein